MVQITTDGLDVAGALIGEAIGRRRKEKELGEFQLALSIIDSIASDREVTPEEAQGYIQGLSEMGVQVPDDVTDLRKVRDSIISKFPVLSAQNRQLLDAPIANLQEQNQAVAELQATLPILGSVLSPEQLQGIVQLAQTDPMAAKDMTRDFTGKFLGNIASQYGQGVGDTKAYDLGGGREVFTEKENIKQGNAQENMVFKLGIDKELAGYKEQLYRSRPKSGSGSSMSDKTIVDYVIKLDGIFKNGMAEIDKSRGAINTRLDKTLTDMNPDDKAVLGQPALMDQSGKPISRSEVLLLGLQGNKLDNSKSASEAATDALIRSGRISGNVQELEAIKNTFNDLEPSDPGSTSRYTPETRQALENIATDYINLDQLKTQEARIKQATPLVQNELVNLGSNVQSQEAVDAINTYLGVSGVSTGMGRVTMPSGQPSDIGISDFAGRIKAQQESGLWDATVEKLGGIVDKVSPGLKKVTEGIGSGLDAVSGAGVNNPKNRQIKESVDLEVETYTQGVVDQLKDRISKSPSPLSESETIANIQEFLNQDKKARQLSPEQLEDLNKTIKERNQKLKGGLQ